MLKTIRTAAAAALLLAAWGCETTKVTSPDIQSITLGASATSVLVGSEVTIQASLVDSQGRALDRQVTWVASGPQVQVSGTGLTATVRGVSAGTVSVSAESEGVVSQSVTIVVNNPTPVIASVAPATVFAGSGAFTLTVTGSSFVNGATVRWNGAARVTTFVSATTLTAAILAADIANGGTGAVTVINPATAAPSNAVNVTIASPAPDLAITALTAPSTGRAGGSLQISMTVVNQGSAPVSAFRVGFYLSTDATITTSDVFTTTCNITGLAAGSPSTCSAQVTIPSTLGPGTYFLGAIADDLGVVNETNENNNTRASGAITITAASAVDLTVTALTAPATSVVGATFSVSMTVANQGTTATGAFRVGFYLSTDATITTSDEGVAICDYAAGLPGGGSHVCNTSIQVPNTLPPGTYFLGAIADDQGAVTEGDETNNTRASTAITISPAPVDLTVTSFTVPSSGVVGGTLAFSMNVSNPGAANSGTFAVGFYYSTDATVTTADVFSGTTCDYPNGLLAGTSNTCTGQVRVPSTLAPGTYFVGAIADHTGRVTETNENNNTRVSPAVSITASLDELAMRVDREVVEELARLGRRASGYLEMRIDTVQRVTMGF